MRKFNIVLCVKFMDIEAETLAEAKDLAYSRILKDTWEHPAEVFVDYLRTTEKDPSLAMEICPYCEGARLQLEGDEMSGWVIRCYDCHVSGPNQMRQGEAVTAWNDLFPANRVRLFSESDQGE